MRRILLLPIALLSGLSACDAGDAGDDDAVGDDDASGDDDTTGDDTTGDDTTSDPGTSLDVGGAADLEGEAGVFTLDPTQAGTYVAVLYSASDAQGTTYAYGDALGRPAVARPSDRAPQVRKVRGTPGRGGDVLVGDTREFSVYDGSQRVSVTGEVVQVTSGMVVYEDITTANPFGAIDEDVMGEAVADFESIVMPRERAVFGEESDVEESGRIDVLISYTVNQYGAQAYVTWCDIGIFPGCMGQGNGSEVLYLSVPDPDDVYSSANAFEETMAHEVNHLIYAWHKFVLNEQLGADENIYFTEGMSALAQDLTGYNNGNQYVWWAAVDASEYYGSDVYSVQSLSVNDAFDGVGYYDAERDGALRGGAYLFLRYLFEQAGGMQIDPVSGAFTDTGGIQWLHDLLATPALGTEALESTTGSDLDTLALDFYTCLVVDGRGISDDPLWNFQPRVEDPLTGYDFGVDMFATFHGWVEMTGPLLQPFRQADGELRAGGVEYLKTALDASETLTLAVDPAADPRVRLVRLE